MKKLIFPAFAIMVFAFTSCKKSTNVVTPAKPSDTSSTTIISTPGYYMKFKLNGTQYNFSYAAVARLSAPDTTDVSYFTNHYPSVIAGYSTAAKSPEFGIELWTLKPAISAGNFTVTPSDTTTTENADFALLVYIQSLPPPGSVYSSQGNTPAVNVTVTTLTSSSISGTFSGKLFGGTGSLSTLQYTVTDGEFYAKLE